MAGNGFPPTLRRAKAQPVRPERSALCDVFGPASLVYDGEAFSWPSKGGDGVDADAYAYKLSHDYGLNLVPFERSRRLCADPAMSM